MNHSNTLWRQSLSEKLLILKFDLFLNQELENQMDELVKQFNNKLQGKCNVLESKGVVDLRRLKETLKNKMKWWRQKI